MRVVTIKIFWLINLIVILVSFQDKCLSQSNEISTLKDQLMNAQEKLQVTVCDFLLNILI